MGFALGFSFVARSIGLLIVAMIPIRVTTTDGKTTEGQFAGVAAATLMVDTEGDVQSFAMEDVQSIEAIEIDDDATGPTNRVTLIGGSQIAAQAMTLKNEVLTIDPRRQPAIVVPLKEVKSIRFRAASPTTDAQWLGLLEQDARGDLLAIRRAGDQLDPAPGLVEGIADGAVKFNMDGDTVLAPIERLEGIVLSNRPSGTKSVIQVVDHYGSRFAAVKIMPSAADEPLKLRLSDSVTHALPLKHLRSIFFSGGIEMLAAQKPASASFSAYVETKLNAELQSKWFAPKADGQDLVINGDGRIGFRVAEGFTTLAGSVRRDQSVDKAGDVEVQILVDDQSVWKETIADEKPRGFELPVDKTRKIEFVVSSGDDGDLGDKVRILRPRLLK